MGKAEICNPPAFPIVLVLGWHNKWTCCWDVKKILVDHENLVA